MPARRSHNASPSRWEGDGLHYGRLWYLGEIGNRRAMTGIGNGGQRLALMPDADLAAVIFSGNYNAPDAWISPTRVWREIVVASLRPE